MCSLFHTLLLFLLPLSLSHSGSACFSPKVLPIIGFKAAEEPGLTSLAVCYTLRMLNICHGKHLRTHTHTHTYVHTLCRFNVCSIKCNCKFIQMFWHYYCCVSSSLPLALLLLALSLPLYLSPSSLIQFNCRCFRA